MLDKICRTCYHTDPRFGTKPYYGVHASTHPQVHIHQNHRDYPLEISQLMNVENNGLVPSANFPFLHLIGPHTLPITIMGACLWHIPLQGQISALFENEYTSEIANICHFWKQIHLKGQNSAILTNFEYTSKRGKCCRICQLFVEVLDKICRTCYHTDPRFGTKPYYGVHASTHPQVHIHQNHRDYPLEISQLMNVENNGLVPSANFPFLNIMGHTTNHYHECTPITHLFIHHTKHFWFFLLMC